MDNFVGSLIMASSISGVYTFYKTFRRRKENDSAVWLLCLCASTVMWAIIYASFFLVKDTSLALFLHEIRYATIMFSGWFVFLFLYRTLKYRMFRRRTLTLFMLFPILNTIVLLTNRYSHLFITYFGMVRKNGLRVPVSEYGPWFILHCALSYLPLLAGTIIIVNQFIHLPAKHKILTGLLFLGMMITSATTLLAIFDVLPYPVDLSPAVVQTTQLIFYYTLFNSRSLDMLYTSRNAIFENSTSIFLIIDIEGCIVDYNSKAMQVADCIQVKSLLGMSADKFIESWQSSVQCHVFKEDPTIFTVVENETDTHYQIQKYDIHGKNGGIKGYYIEIKNIKPIMTLIHMLEDAAYYDNLTGLPNRNYLSKHLDEIDTSQFFPLCVMVGDVNGLKAVNDTYGHVKGDDLLKRISGILIRCAPRDALFFRTGGDEFVGMLPNTSTEQADLFVEEVEKHCSAMVDPAFSCASIALGYKIKSKDNERIEDLIEAADYEMYTTKRDRRAT